MDWSKIALETLAASSFITLVGIGTFGTCRVIKRRMSLTEERVTPPTTFEIEMERIWQSAREEAVAEQDDRIRRRLRYRDRT